MKLDVEVLGGVLQFKQMPDNFKDGVYEVDIKNTQSRTSQQNRALHLWCTMISNTLNKENIPTTQVLKADIDWTMEKVKYMVMKPLIEALFQTSTTTKLSKDDFDVLIDTLTKAMGHKGIEIPPFPNREDMK